MHDEHEHVTLEEARRIEAAATPAARALIATVLVAMLTTQVALRFADVALVRVVLTWAAPLFLVGLLALAWRLRRTSPVRVNLRLQWAGSLVIAATATFDVVITVVKDPTLSWEANPFTRMLLDSDHSLTFVKAYGVTCQVLFVTLLVVFLSVVLAHAEPVRISAWAMAPRNRKEFVTAATRGITDTSPLHGLRLRDWLSMKAHPCAIWIASMFSIGSCFGRTASGLGWLGFWLPPVVRVIVICVGIVVVINAAWARSWRRGPPPELRLAPSAAAVPAPAWHRYLERAVIWIGLPLIVLGALAEPGYRNARWVSSQLDERIDALRIEVTESRIAALHAREIAAEVKQLQATWDDAAASRAIPCEIDHPTLMAEVRAIVEPLGMQVEGAEFPRRMDYRLNYPIRVTLAEQADAGSHVIALAGSERILHLVSRGEWGRHALILAYEYACVDACSHLRDHRETVLGRDQVAWPFELVVVRREREIDRLLDERDRHADALELLLRQHYLTEAIPRRQSIAAELARKGTVSE